MSMELIKPGVNIDFVGKIKYAIIFSAILIIIGIASVIYHGGFNLGIDLPADQSFRLNFQTTYPPIRFEHLSNQPNWKTAPFNSSVPMNS